MGRRDNLLLRQPSATLTLLVCLRWTLVEHPSPGSTHFRE